MLFGHKKCTEKTIGKVVRLYSKGSNFPFMMRVEYTVNNKTYFVEESVKLKNDKIKNNFLIVGQKQVPVIHELVVGKELTVMYNPNKPKRAYIKENIGIINC